jgi:hypothetical protein
MCCKLPFHSALGHCPCRNVPGHNAIQIFGSCMVICTTTHMGKVDYSSMILGHQVLLKRLCCPHQCGEQAAVSMAIIMWLRCLR